MRTGTLALVALVFALLPSHASAAGASAAKQMAQYRTLQANVDQAFLWAYLNKNHENIRPASGKTRYLGAKIVSATGSTFFFNCHFYTVRSPIANAITTPKGSIFLYEGLDRLKLTGPSRPRRSRTRSVTWPAPTGSSACSGTCRPRSWRPTRSERADAAARRSASSTR